MDFVFFGARRPRSHSLRLSLVISLVLLTLSAFAPAYASTTYTMSLATNATSYTGSQIIVITGKISPPPVANTSVVVRTANPSGSVIDTGLATPSFSTGVFNYTLFPYPGGYGWIGGTFSVNATWGGNGATATAVVTFTYTPTVTTTYAMTLQTNAPAYNGTTPILITGVISPAPGRNTGVIIDIENPTKNLVDIGEAIPNSSTGSFNYTSHPGGTSAWTSGTYFVNATWSGGGATISKVVTFKYSPSTSNRVYSMTLGTNMPSYSGNEPIIITGAISPTPGANTGVVITTRNPGGNIVDTGVTNPSSVGSFNYTLVPGGPAWTAGTFSVNATWGGSGGTASRVVTFKYSPAVSTTYTMTLQTNAASYNGTEPIVITGLISPAPGPNTAVVITVTNPKVSVVDIGEAPVSSSTGSFNYTLVSGGNAAWISGTFSVNATWSGDGAIASRLVTFVYSRTTTSSTTSTSTSTRTSNTTSSTTTSPTTSSTASALVQNVTTKWDPFTDFYNFLNHGLFNDGGDCYGFSSTAILYFRHYQLGDQTYPYYPQPTSSVSAMTGQTGKYCLGQLGCLEQEDVLSQSTFPLYIHQTYGQEQSVLYGNETTQAQLMMQSIQNGIPVILGLGPTDGHAVIAFDYQQFSNGNLVIGISDPNYGNTPRYAYYANGQFSYVGTYSWTTFEVISPEMLQWAWLSPYQLSGTVNQTNAYYTYVFSTAPITIVSGSGRASFSLSGDSLSFSNSISGVVGFEERGIQAYAIPKGVSYTVLDPGTTSSNVLVIIPQNQTSIVGYQLTSTSAKPLNVTISPTLANLNVTAASAMNLSVSLFSVGGQSQSIINATSLPIAPSQTAVFSVPNWGNLNSTQSGANLEVFQANKTAPIATYTLAKGQQNLSPTSSAFPLSSSALATAAVVIVALLAYVGIRRRGQPTPMKNAGPVPK